MAPQSQPPRRVLRLPEVCRKVGLKQDSIYKKVREKTFPAPFKISERATGWFEHELDDWLDERAKTQRQTEPHS